MNRSKGQRVLGIAIFLTLAFCIIEFIGGKISGSLALLADAGHMLTDLAALVLAYFAGLVAAKRATRRMSFGFYRIEVLSALINGAALLTLAVFIIREAFHRFSNPLPVHTPLMMAVAFFGLLFNIANGLMLRRYARHNMNIRGAFFHIISDALGSVGTLAAGAVIIGTKWPYADPAVSCFIALLIVISAWKLLKDVVEVLLEATPAHIDTRLLEKKILPLPGIRAIHDLHVWTISPGKVSLSAHLVVEDNADRDQVLHEVNEVLFRDFHIDHPTLQIEAAPHSKKERSHFHD